MALCHKNKRPLIKRVPRSSGQLAKIRDKKLQNKPKKNIPNQLHCNLRRWSTSSHIFNHHRKPLSRPIKRQLYSWKLLRRNHKLLTLSRLALARESARKRRQRSRFRVFWTQHLWLYTKWYLSCLTQLSQYSDAQSQIITTRKIKIVLGWWSPRLAHLYHREDWQVRLRL